MFALSRRRCDTHTQNKSENINGQRMSLGTCSFFLLVVYKVKIGKSSLFVECIYTQDVVMQFKVHTVKELYPDLDKYYDNREENIGMFNIIEPGIVDFDLLEKSLRCFGYNGGAEVYYLNPGPGSTPSIGYGLTRIVGHKEVNEFVRAHAEAMTKICHLYLVGPEDVSIGFYSQIILLMQLLML
jgi:hypothetical protein